MDIKTLSQEQVFEYFYSLMAEIECGSSFDFSNEKSILWLNRKIQRRFGAENLSRKHNIQTMYISTYAGDTNNIAYYGKRGFAPVAVLPDVNSPNDEGQIYMRKKLNP